MTELTIYRGDLLGIVQEDGNSIELYQVINLTIEGVQARFIRGFIKLDDIQHTSFFSSEQIIDFLQDERLVVYKPEVL